mmetsp:Transcript_42117/g.112336  ORF Transcript_42117/g.112336 Transcript_42117/m.112336 type:complete len:674 (-) Transcript_42117:257-2278(-)|eukprot:CAMPEP_0119482168 /NCGR_PEP_ID=MMETSP1344-20130328/10150_1 /TAXON_ID=236787 /ORGANISM="Florenciella parvula, Strain CCMP2471" /LENGTH=673 /DNA_ID=CAMNT_0007516553 /DNA_START=106 /DNA_END=2127 /DNA_ORIENTATION=+
MLEARTGDGDKEVELGLTIDDAGNDEEGGAMEHAAKHIPELPLNQRVKLTYNVTLDLPNAVKKQKGAPKDLPDKVRILSDVKGEILPGQMVAIMGASGAGKTSLLNCLAMKVQSQYISAGGSADQPFVFVNDKAVSSAELSSMSGFVHQDDLFIATITPREHLSFITALTIPPSETQGPEALKAKVQSTLDDFGLSKCADILIGGGFAQIKGISGGERKRLSTASEFISRPPVIFLDEPTSGLDSYMAREVVELLQKLAAKGHTIVATIHQPASDVFDMFSDLCLLATDGSGGRTAYMGSRSGAPAYFDGLGQSIPAYYNPADFYIRCLAVKIGNAAVRDASKKELKTICDKFSEYQTNEKLTVTDGEDKSSEVAAPPPTEMSARPEPYQASQWTQLSQLVIRARVAAIRDPVLTKARAGQTFFLSIVIGSMYAYSIDNSDTLVQNIMGASFFMVLNQGILGLLSVLQVFPLDIPLFLREVAAGRYRVHNYVLARMAAEVPLQMVFPAIFGTILYFFVGMRPIYSPVDFAVFCELMFVVVLTANASVSMGYAVGALCRTPQVALAVGPAVMLPLAIFGGLLMNSDAVPPYWKWLEVFSFFKYGFHASSILLWKNREIDDKFFPNGDSVLEAYGIDSDTLHINYIALATLFVGWRIIAYLLLVRRTKQESGSGM